MRRFVRSSRRRRRRRRVFCRARRRRAEPPRRTRRAGRRSRRASRTHAWRRACARCPRVLPRQQSRLPRHPSSWCHPRLRFSRRMRRTLPDPWLRFSPSRPARARRRGARLPRATSRRMLGDTNRRVRRPRVRANVSRRFRWRRAARGLKWRRGSFQPAPTPRRSRRIEAPRAR